MINFLIKKFIKNSNDYDNPKVRQRYGVFCSVVSICLNLLLVVFKLSMGVITNSVAIQADALNNLSDVGSNFASLFGFKLSNKHPDADHPYGHGRAEYVAGLIISFLILLVGFQAIKDSVLKIINPQEVNFSIIACVILVVSIFIKFWMSILNRNIGKKINSLALKAAAQDSINDCVTTSATLVSLILSMYTDLPVDGIFGAGVSIIVIKAGIEVFKDTVNPLLGMAPDKELIKAVQEFIMAYDVTLGIHDLIIHDYGPGRKFLTLHVEVDCNEDIMFVHDTIDIIERDVLEKFALQTTIHMDPIDINDDLTNELKDIVMQLVTRINSKYTIHDFRIISGTTHINLIFDVLIPNDDEVDIKELKQQIIEKIKQENKNYYAVIEIDRSFV